jgi:hypothetical protein
LNMPALHWFQFAMTALGFVLVLSVMILELQRRPNRGTGYNREMRLASRAYLLCSMMI